MYIPNVFGHVYIPNVFGSIICNSVVYFDFLWLATKVLNMNFNTKEFELQEFHLY